MRETPWKFLFFQKKKYCSLLLLYVLPILEVEWPEWEWPSPIGRILVHDVAWAFDAANATRAVQPYHVYGQGRGRHAVAKY